MASLTFDKNSNASIYVRLRSGGRRPVRLGKVGRNNAEKTRGYITELETATLRGIAPDAQTRAWLAGVSGDLRDRLAKCGLCQASPGVVGIGSFIDGYLAQRVDVKTGTMKVLLQARRHLVRHTGEDRSVNSITSADADAFRAALIGRGIAKATVAKWCRIARHFFSIAHRRGTIDANPFGHIKAAMKGNAARRVFVSAADIIQVMDIAPDTQWRLLIALARWGGLRTPSEPLALKWTDVDFDRRRFIVRASKTEHHEAGGVRVVPMFPELAEHFQAAFDEAPVGAEHVITRYRDPTVNLRTGLIRLIERAGLKPWPKPWQNLRASRATELADEYPSHICTAWLGHTEAVADEFYRTVTDEHFDRASAPAVRQAVRAGGAHKGTEEQSMVAAGTVGHGRARTDLQVGREGFEPP